MAFDKTHAFANDCGSIRRGVQFRVSESPVEWKPSTIILNDEFPRTFRFQQLNQHVSGAAMLAHIDQCFLSNSGEFSADRLRQEKFLVVHYEPSANPSLSLEAIDRVV